MEQTQLTLEKLHQNTSAVTADLQTQLNGKGRHKPIKLPKRELLKSLSIQVSRPVCDYSTVLQTISSFAPDHGWICSQSAVVTLMNETFDSAKLQGILLNAELAVKHNSLHIHQVSGGWTLVHTSENDLAPPLEPDWQAMREPAPALVEEQGFISTESTPKHKINVLYRVFYSIENHDDGVQAVASRFHKFKSE